MVDRCDRDREDRGAALVATSVSAQARTVAWIVNPNLQGWAKWTKELPMTQFPTFIGIDVAKSRLDCMCRPQDETFSVSNDTAGIEALVERLLAFSPVLVVLEATGNYQMAVVAALVTANVPVAVVNPRQVRDFAKATGQLAKTDAIDAGVLAHFAEAMRPDPRPVPDEATQHLKLLLTRRRQLLEMLKAEHQRLSNASSVVRDNIKRSIGYLKQLLADTDGDLSRAIRTSSVWQGALRAQNNSCVRFLGSGRLRLQPF